MPEPSASLRLYRRLLSLYPASFRDEYAAQMERQFRDELADAGGFLPRVALWLGLLADLALSVPAQMAREIAQDSRHALRQWARRPLNTAFAIAALAIGIGANIGIFSVVDALLLRPLPFYDPNSLVGLYIFRTPHDTAAQFYDWLQHSSYLSDAALVQAHDANLEGVSQAVRVHFARTSSNFFTFLGVQPAAGRTFLTGEDGAGRNNVAVISFGLWQGLFGGDSKALGATIHIDGEPLTVVGIAPAGFDYPHDVALWQPADFRPGDNSFSTIARLKPGLSIARARAAFLAEADRLSPDRRPADKAARPAVILPLQDGLSSDPEAPPHSPPSPRTGSLILFAGAALILLIACTNVANLLLARTAERAGELSVRSALGASRARIVQQLLTECVLLSIFATIAGLAVASWITGLATRLQPAPIGLQNYSLLDLRVIGFTLLVSLLCGCLFGVLPALYASRVHTFAGRGVNLRTASRRTREILVAAQVALTLVLLASSFSINQAFRAYLGMDRGFERQGVASVSVSITGTTRNRGDARLDYFEQVLDRVRQLPGVRSASATEFLPLTETPFLGGPFSFDGRPARENAMVVPVMPQYLETMGGRLIAGREFTAQDLHSDAPVALVNGLFAQEFGAPADAVGHQLRNGRTTWTVIGVFKGMVYLGDYNHTQVLLPDRQPGAFGVTIVARVDGRAEDRIAAVRDTVKSVDPNVPVFGVTTLDQRLQEALQRPRFYSVAAFCFAGFALLLAVIGIYGVVSYAVTQRNHEMGVRLALGTTSGRLRAAILAESLFTVAVGAVPGILGALLGGRFLMTLVEGAQLVGWAPCVGAAALIAVSAATAVWTATRRIVHLDVMEVLRVD